MQSYSSSNSQSLDQFSLAEFQKLASLGLSEQLNLLKNKFQYPETQFVFLLERVTSQFLADQKNEIQQNDFHVMASILCDYLEIMQEKIESLSCNTQRPDQDPRMDLATSYHYENYRSILQKYSKLYGQYNVENYQRIAEFLSLLDPMFRSATEQSPTVTIFEDSEYEKTFNIGSSRRTAMVHESLPQTVGLSAPADNKENPLDGVRVTEAEIERNLRPIPAKYKDAKYAQPVFPGLYFSDSSVLDSNQQYGDPLKQQLAAPRRIYMDFRGQRKFMRNEQVNNLSQQLDIDRVDEEILQHIKKLELSKEIVSLKEGIETSIQTLKERAGEIDQKFIQTIPPRLTQLKSHIASLADKYKQAAVSHFYNSAIKAYPSLAGLVDEVAEVEKLNKKLASRLTKPKKHPKQLLSFLLQAEKPKKTRSAPKAEVFDEMEPLEQDSSPLENLSQQVPAKQPKQDAEMAEVDLGNYGISKEVAKITQEQLAILKKYLGRKSKGLISLYQGKDDIENSESIAEIYKVIYKDKNAQNQGLCFLLPEVWDVNKTDDFQTKETERKKQPSRHAKLEFQIVKKEEDAPTAYLVPPSPRSSDDSSRQANLLSPVSSPELNLQLTHKESKKGTGSSSRKRQRSNETEDSKVEGPLFSNNVTKISRTEFQALSELFNFTKLSLLKEEIESKYCFSFEWTKQKKDSEHVIRDKKAIDIIYAYIISRNPAYNRYPSNWIELNNQKKQQNTDQERPQKRLKQEATTPSGISEGDNAFPFNGALEFSPPALENPSAEQRNGGHSNSHGTQQPQMQPQPNLRMVFKRTPHGYAPQQSGMSLPMQAPEQRQQLQQPHMPVNMPSLGQPNMPVQMPLLQQQLMPLQMLSLPQQPTMPLRMPSLPYQGQVPLQMPSMPNLGQMPLQMPLPSQPLSQQRYVPLSRPASPPRGPSFFQQPGQQNGVSSSMPNTLVNGQQSHQQSQSGFFSGMPFRLGTNGANAMLPLDDSLSFSQSPPRVGMLPPQKQSDDDFVKGLFI